MSTIARTFLATVLAAGTFGLAAVATVHASAATSAPAASVRVLDAPPAAPQKLCDVDWC